MSPLVLNILIIVLSHSDQWSETRYKEFFNDIDPYLTKKDVTDLDLSNIYLNYVNIFDELLLEEKKNN